MTNNIFTETLANGGGTWTVGTLVPVTHGIAVGAIDGTYALVPVDDEAAFALALFRLRADIHAGAIVADAFGTWVEDGNIHLDPIVITNDEEAAYLIALANNQLAYYIIHEQREVRL